MLYSTRKTLTFIYILFSSLIAFGQEESTSNVYISKVPFYSFSSDLETQEQELKDNPIILRMKKSRDGLSEDKYRPIYHYVNPEGNLNDPNGLCFWNGNWHLFYQAYPPEDPRQHWGHAVSKDLVFWRDLPYAIYPNPERNVYSGSAFAEEDRVIAMYHGTLVGNMVATSSDPLLLNWEKLGNGAVVPLESSTGFQLPYSVFDPCIWKKDGIYYSLSGGRASNGPGNAPIRANYLFRSKDLLTWEYMHEFVEGDRFTLVGDDGACPYFWPIGDKYILNFFSHMSGGQYLLGDYDKDRDKFIVTSAGKYNFGSVSPSGVHAPSVTPDGKGNLIIIFNMNPGKPTKGWNQVMSLPRRLRLTSSGEIEQEPAGDLSVLRYNEQQVEDVDLPANKEIVFKKIKGNAIEIEAEIDMKNSEIFEINILRSQKKEEYTKIVVYKNRGYSSGLSYIAGESTAMMPADLLRAYTGENISTNRRQLSLISLETANSSLSSDVRLRPPETAPFFLGSDEKVKLSIFIDKSVVEVFVNGRQCVAARVYPERDDSIGVSARSQGNEAKLVLLKAWSMKSIYQ